MIDLDQLVEIHWHSKNKKHYIEKGYKYTKLGDSIFVKAKDLTPKSTAKVKVICDYCGKEKIISYCDFTITHSDKYGDTCVDCAKIKRRLTNLNKYGAEWYTQTDEFKNKREASMTQIYGNPHSLQNDVIKEKFKQTCLKNNGVEYPMQSVKIQEKSQQTCLKNNGVKYPMQSQEVRNKSIKTCLNKYGYRTTANVPFIREKQRLSLYKNNNLPISIPEQKTIDLLKEIYGDSNCIQQFPTKYYNLDCLLLLNNLKIDVEYDGQWCHKESFDTRRDKYHINKGYKILRIKGNHLIPTKEQIINAVKDLTENNKNYTEILLNT